MIIAFTIAFSSFAALRPPVLKPTKQEQAPTAATSRVIVEHADIFRYDADEDPDIQKLVGNVVLKHENAIMYCDSAYLNQRLNSFEAFGSVKMNQADTVFVYSRYLNYDGNSRLASLRHDVRMENRSATLFTDSLDYDREADLAYYFNGGSIVDSLNTLESDYGEYSPSTSEALFLYNVELINEEYTMKTEELRYNTETNISLILGPTEIVSDSGRIVSTRGVFDSKSDVAILLDRSIVYSDSYELTGDSIYYDRKTSFGEAFGDMILTDTLNKAKLNGQYGYFDEKKEYAFATERAFLTDYSAADTLWAAADTLELISSTDSLDPWRIAKGYKHVRLFRRDVQAVADSLEYLSKDSVLTLYYDPILWNEESQLAGDTIAFYFRNDSLDYVDVRSNALAIQQIDSTMHDQLGGRRIKAIVRDSTIKRVEVYGNAELIKYEQQSRTGRWYMMNRLECPSILADFENDRLEKALLMGKVSGKGYPIEMLTPELRYLNGFRWEDALRPKNKNDLFRKDSSSVSQPYKHPALSDLRKFSGALASLRAYNAIAQAKKRDELLKAKEELEKRAAQSADDAEAITEAAPIEPEETDEKTQLSPYIRRESETNEKYINAADLFERYTNTSITYLWQ